MNLPAYRACAAVLSTLWNRWCTHARYQNKNAPTNKCLFLCSDSAEDSIEHYCQCPTTKKVLNNKLKLDPTLHANLHTLLPCNIHTTTNLPNPMYTTSLEGPHVKAQIDGVHLGSSLDLHEDSDPDATMAGTQTAVPVCNSPADPHPCQLNP